MRQRADFFFPAASSFLLRYHTLCHLSILEPRGESSLWFGDVQL